MVLTVHLELLLGALFVIKAPTLSIRIPIPVTTQPTQPSESDSYDLMKEKAGYFTTGWTQNAWTSFNRTLGIVEICYGPDKCSFVGYTDELNQFPVKHPGYKEFFDVIQNGNSLCVKTFRYVRDNRGNVTLPLKRKDIIYIKSSSGPQAENTYSKSKEAVWQLEIPPNNGAYLTLNPVDIQPSSDGVCVDYISVYFDDNVPTIICGNVDQIVFSSLNASRITIKFVSDEYTNQGHFHGGLFIASRHYIQMFLYSRPQNMPMMSNDHEAEGMERESRMAIVGSGHGKPVPIAIGGKDNSKPEDVPDDDDDNDDGVEPYRKELNEGALFCFNEIVKFSRTAALKYMSGPSWSLCRVFAKVLLEDGYTTPV